MFTRRGVSLNAGALQRKMVQARRGGFEHNSLLREALPATGFELTGLMARVVHGMDAAAITPPRHMMLRIDLPEGLYGVDVGFGNLTPTAPIALAPQECELRHEHYRLTPRLTRYLAMRHLGGRTERREMRSAEDYRTTLADPFGLAPHDDEPALLMRALEAHPTPRHIRSFCKRRTAARPPPPGRYTTPFCRSPAICSSL